MENIILFLETFLGYSMIWWFWFWPNATETQRLRNTPKALAIIALLSFPLNINGNVFTVLGNAESSKSIYSVFSPYQKAGGDAHSVLGSFFQKAGNDAYVYAGVAGYQEATNAYVGVGVAGYQEAKFDAIVGLGLSGYQKSGHESGMVMGIAGFQKSKMDATNILGLTGYQKAGRAAGMLCCFAGRQNAINASSLVLGLVGYQYSETKTNTYASMAVYQSTPKEDRAFAVWSTIEN